MNLIFLNVKFMSIKKSQHFTLILNQLKYSWNVTPLKSYLTKRLPNNHRSGKIPVFYTKMFHTIFNGKVIDANDVNTGDKYLTGVGDIGPHKFVAYDTGKRAKNSCDTIPLKIGKRPCVEGGGAMNFSANKQLKILVCCCWPLLHRPPLHGANI